MKNKKHSNERIILEYVALRICFSLLNKSFALLNNPLTLVAIFFYSGTNFSKL